MESPDWLWELSANNQGDPSVATMQNSERLGREVNREFHRVGIYPDKLAPELRDLVVGFGLASIHNGKIPPELRHLARSGGMSRLHPQKMAWQLRELIKERAVSESGDWLWVDSRFANAYMAALAAMLSREVAVSPLTGSELPAGMNLRCLLEDVATSGPTDARGALVTFVMEGLRIDPQTPVQRLIAFRRSRTDQLAELSGYLVEFASKIEKSESARQLQHAAKAQYENRIRPGLQKLKSELDAQSLHSVWEGLHRAATISVPAGGAFTFFAGAPGHVVLGIGGALTVADVAVRSYFARQKARTSPYTYHLDAEKKFAIPNYVRRAHSVRE